MKFSRQIIVLGALSLVACGLSIVGAEPAPVADAGGGATVTPPATSEPILDSGPPVDDAEADASDAGPHGTALELDGLTDFVRAKRTVADSFTLEAWIQTTKSLGQPNDAFFLGAPILWADVPLDSDDFGVGIVADKLAFGAKNVTIRSSASVDTGAWVHIAVTRTKSTGAMAIFVNGVADGAGTGPLTTLDDSPTLDLGGNIRDARYFKGRIREVRVWNIARSPADILATMNARLVGNEASLQSYWRLDDGSGITAADSSGKNNPGTLGAADAGAGPDASTRPTWVTF